MPRTLYLETFGCQMNVLDSELVSGRLGADGYEMTRDRDAADVVIFNTCSVREHAEQKVWSRLGLLASTAGERPDRVIGVIGCMAERDGERLFDRFPHVDLLCGPGELDKLPDLVRNATLDKLLRSDAPPAGPAARHVALIGATTRRSSTLAAAEDHLELLDLSRAISPSTPAAQAYVRITRGCNKFCTYCVVPYTRGPEVHRPPGNILEEVRRLADAGTLEVTLLGQTINHYAYAHGDGRVTTFADLLYLLHEGVPSLPRLRFVTSYPRDFTDAALDAMRDCERVCRYLHVPAQHGSDRVLKLMNRGYTTGHYFDFIDRARERMPDVSLASDFIVGFPTETDEDVEQTARLIRRCRFKNSFIFKYSPRPGTVAIGRYADDVPNDAKRRRNHRLLAVQHEVTRDVNAELVGRRAEVIVEGFGRRTPRPTGNGAGVELGERLRRPRCSNEADASPVQLSGRTRGDQIVLFDGSPSLVGRLADVDVTDARGLSLFGDVAETPVPVGLKAPQGAVA